MTSHTLFGIRFDAVTAQQALERLVALAKNAKALQLPAQLAVTVNVQIMVLARRNSQTLLPIINAAPLVVADGAPLVFASKFFGPKLPERVAGSDLIYDIARAAADNGLRIYFFGGQEAYTVQAMEKLKALFPSLQIAGHSCPMVAMTPNETQRREEEALCRQITDANTDILLVGLGCPKQEYFVHRNADKLKGMAAIGLGGTFNFICGHISRAPKWMQRLGMEWIYRILQEPKRLFMRYFIDAFYLAAYILREPFRRQCEESNSR